MDEQKIQKILDNHKKMLATSKEKYHTVRKLDPIFMAENRQRANEWYKQNKDKRKEHYEKNRELLNSKTQYHYYKNRDNLPLFKQRHPEKYTLLVEVGYIKDP
tara:strand:+ start:301 stop:609 length:309 start_codon:yes stop_codon:yes gene_type:complete